MPVVHFNVRWPDGSLEPCYSPSTVIKDHFEVGRVYSLAEFVTAARAGLHAASERVRVRYGAGCSHAMAQLASIEAKAKRLTAENASVEIEGFS